MLVTALMICKMQCIQVTTKQKSLNKMLQHTNGNQVSYQNHHLRSRALACHHLEMTHSLLKALVKDHHNG